jgi:hypothetical protein
LTKGSKKYFAAYTFSIHRFHFYNNICGNNWQMKKIIVCALASFGFSQIGHAQVEDTINTNNLKLNIKAFQEGKSTYAVYMMDSAGNRMGAAQLWDRTIRFSTDAQNRKLYNFEWKWYMRDSLIGLTNATGLLPSLKPLTHKADYVKRGRSSFVFNNDVATVPNEDKKDGKDSSFRVVLDPPAFEFPMDLEIFPLLPFKSVNQKFAIAFYEPGTPQSDYYHLTIVGKEDVALPGGTKVNCWLLKIDYGQQGAYALFWISDKTREVLKMKEEFRGRFRYKVKLY